MHSYVMTHSDAKQKREGKEQGKVRKMDTEKYKKVIVRNKGRRKWKTKMNSTAERGEQGSNPQETRRYKRNNERSGRQANQIEK